MAKPNFDRSVQFWTTEMQDNALQSLADDALVPKAALMRSIVSLYLQHIGYMAPRPQINGHDHIEAA